MSRATPHCILVVANETLGGRALIDAVKRRAEEAHARNKPFRVCVVCPQNQPKSGYVIYDESVRSAAENRLQTTLAQLREIGIEAEGEVMDPDPFAATMDAVDHFKADEIIISTHPETRSGWLRKHLVDRVQDRDRAAGRARGRGPRRRSRRHAPRRSWSRTRPSAATR